MIYGSPNCRKKTEINQLLKPILAIKQGREKQGSFEADVPLFRAVMYSMKVVFQYKKYRNLCTDFTNKYSYSAYIGVPIASKVDELQPVVNALQTKELRALIAKILNIEAEQFVCDHYNTRMAIPITRRLIAARERDLCGYYE